jgi:hypothetical protein
VRRQADEGKHGYWKLVFGFEVGSHRAYMIEFSVPNARSGFLNRAAPKSMDCLINMDLLRFQCLYSNMASIIKF